MNAKTLARIRSLLIQIEQLRVNEISPSQLGTLNAEAILLGIELDIVLSKVKVPVEADRISA